MHAASHSSVVFITHLSSSGSSTPPRMRTLRRWRTSPCATRASRRRTRSTASSPWASFDPARMARSALYHEMILYVALSKLSVLSMSCNVSLCPIILSCVDDMYHIDRDHHGLTLLYGCFWYLRKPCTPSLIKSSTHMRIPSLPVWSSNRVFFHYIAYTTYA